MDICILQLGTFGDMILATPIISAIKNKYPNAKISFIAGGRNFVVIKHNPNVKTIYVWNKYPHNIFKNLFLLRKDKFDYYVDPKDHFSYEGKIIANLVRANVKVGYNSIKGKCFDITVPDEAKNYELHFTQRVFQAFNSLGINLNTKTIPRPELYYPNKSLEYVEKFLEENNLNKGNYIFFNISASHPRKTFNDEALKFIFSSIDRSMPIVLGFDVRDTIKALDLKKEFSFLHLFFSGSILDIFALIENSCAVVTPDTSTVHIATAYSKPTLAFYSGLDNFFNKFHPNNPKCIVVRAEKGDHGIQSITISKIVKSINDFFPTIQEVL